MANYDVGYKKPPMAGQFKPGRSGNPKGRVKGHRNLKTDLMEELSQSIIITENGKKVRLSKQRVILKQLCTKSINGDAASARLLANLILKYLVDEPDADNAMENTMPAEDKELLDYFVKNQGKKHE